MDPLKDWVRHSSKDFQKKVIVFGWFLELILTVQILKMVSRNIGLKADLAKSDVSNLYYEYSK